MTGEGPYCRSSDQSGRRARVTFTTSFWWDDRPTFRRRRSHCRTSLTGRTSTSPSILTRPLPTAYPYKQPSCRETSTRSTKRTRWRTMRSVIAPSPTEALAGTSQQTPQRTAPSSPQATKPKTKTTPNKKDKVLQQDNAVLQAQSPEVSRDPNVHNVPSKPFDEETWNSTPARVKVNRPKSRHREQ